MARKYTWQETEEIKKQAKYVYVAHYVYYRGTPRELRRAKRLRPNDEHRLYCDIV